MKPATSAPTPEACHLQRRGVIYTDLAMIAGVTSTCEDCEGKQLQDGDLLDYHLGRPDVGEPSDVGHQGPGVLRRRQGAHAGGGNAILDRLADVGLGCLSLDQPASPRRPVRRRAATALGYALPHRREGRRLHPRRGRPGLTSPTSSSCSPADRLRITAGKSIIVSRAPPGGHGARRLDHRPRPGAGHDSGRIVFEAAPPTSSPPAPPSPASTSRPTSRPDHAPRTRRRRWAVESADDHCRRPLACAARSARHSGDARMS